MLPADSLGLRDPDRRRPFRGRFTGGDTAPRALDLHEIRRAASEGADLDEELIAGTYDEEVAFVDAQLERLLDAMAERGVLDTTLILLTADHGEELFDHGGFEHGHSMYQELLRVPLIAWGPGVAARRIATPVTLLDVYPTVLDGLGVRVPRSARGISLVPVLTGRASPPGRALVSERTVYGDELRAVVEWPWKLVELDPDTRDQLRALGYLR